jgi:hypothetical protein
MKSKENCQSEIIMAWAMAALQAMKDSRKRGIEVPEDMAAIVRAGLYKEEGDIPVSPDEYVDIYDVPSVVFNLAEENENLKDINRGIKLLKPEFRKLLHFIVQGHEPKIISESMGYEDDTVFWMKKTECLVQYIGNENDLTDKQREEILIVFEKNSKIRDSFLFNMDVMNKQNKKKSNRNKWVITSLIAVLVPSIFFFFAYPRLIQKDFQTLFDYGVERSEFVMTIDSTQLLDDMIFEVEEYSPDFYWLLSLKSLQNGDTESCRDNLKALKGTDFLMFKEKGRYIYQRLKK